VTDPLTDLIATAHWDTPILDATARDMGLEGIQAEPTREYLHPALEADGLGWEEPPRRHYGRWLHANEIPLRARRPWVAAEQLGATQQIPIVEDETI